MWSKAVPASAWFVAALIPMVGSQIVRLHQHDPASWIFWDYAGRFGALAILAAIPSARAVAFRREPRQIALWKVALWIAGIVLADYFAGAWIRSTINTSLPATALGRYPALTGWLYWFDLVFGLALVAYSEEVIFRRCPRHVFRSYLGDRHVLVLVTSVLFGGYHWWTGLGNIAEAILVGVLLMLLLQRSGALWPAVVAHYLSDVTAFA
jgi:uncharacterized protein